MNASTRVEHSAFDIEPSAVNPFAVANRPQGGGVVAALQQREESEVFAMVAMAKRFPREPRECMDRILNAFARPSLAEVSQYQFARGGTDIVGPSIRSAEAIAQEWGNLDTGWKEISRGIGPNAVPYSEVMAYAVDLQTTTRKTLAFIVPHWRDTKSGGYKLKDERDIYELCANQAQRRLRACILALIPGDVVEQAMNQAAVTLKTSADVSPDAQKKLVAAFESWGITKEHIEARIQRRLDAITPAQMVQMKRIYVSLRDDMSRPSDWFEIDPNAAAPAPTPTPAPKAFYPADKFVTELEKWKALILTKKKTPDQIIQLAETKHPLSDEQKAAIRAVVAPRPDAPKFERAAVEKALDEAKTRDALDNAASNIEFVADPKDREALNTKYEQRASEIELNA